MRELVRPDKKLSLHSGGIKSALAIRIPAQATESLLQ